MIKIDYEGRMLASGSLASDPILYFRIPAIGYSNFWTRLGFTIPREGVVPCPSEARDNTIFDFVREFTGPYPHESCWWPH